VKELLRDWDAVRSSFGLDDESSTVLRAGLEYASGNAVATVETLASVDKNPWARYHRVRALLSLRRWKDALELVRKAKGADVTPSLRYLEVEALCRSGEELAGAKIVEELRATEGESADWAYAHGICEECAGEYRAAIDAFRLAAERDRQHAEAWFRLGYLLDLYGTDEEDDRDDAVHAYEACTRVLPLHTSAVINLGLIYEDRERYHDAIKCYEAVLKAQPNHVRARIYLADALASTRMFYDRDQEKKADRHSQILKIPVTDFELSVRSRNCLQKMNIDTLGDLIMKTEAELLAYKNFGETSLKEIKDMLAQKGLRLGQGLVEHGPESAEGRNPLEATASPEVLDGPIDELQLSVRSRRCMDRLEVRTIRDLINKTEVELMSAKNFGMTSLNEIKKKLGEMGLGLRP
jgi:DNA-directed RNA polymerase subunit alpha